MNHLDFGPKKLGFGLMRLPLLDPEDPSRIDMEQTKQMVDTFLERGFTYFDTAYMYHDFQSERAIGEALVKRHPRDSFTLTSKLPTMFLEKKEDMDRIFQEQLDKCGVDYFDFYLIHNLSVSHYEIAQRLDCFSFVQAQKAAGKIKKFGFSFHDSAELLDQILTDHPETEVVQLQINYLDWEDAGIQSRKCYEVARKHGKDIIVMEPVKGGTLADIPAEAEALFRAKDPAASPASWAIRYAAGLEGVKMVLSGMSNMEQLLDNTGYMADFQPLSAAQQAAIRQAVEIIQASIAIPCTACSYCVDGCPMHIPIPKYFALYNAEKRNPTPPGGFSNQRGYYENAAKIYGKASDCIECGQCQSQCPQHLDVPALLKDVVQLLEVDA